MSEVTGRNVARFGLEQVLSPLSLTLRGGLVKGQTAVLRGQVSSKATAEQAEESRPVTAGGAPAAALESPEGCPWGMPVGLATGKFESWVWCQLSQGTPWLGHSPSAFLF